VNGGTVQGVQAAVRAAQLSFKSYRAIEQMLLVPGQDGEPDDTAGAVIVREDLRQLLLVLNARIQAELQNAIDLAGSMPACPSCATDIDRAIGAGRLLHSQREWAEALRALDSAALAKYLAGEPIAAKPAAAAQTTPKASSRPRQATKKREPVAA
jgi:hypothetical protein